MRCALETNGNGSSNSNGNSNSSSSKLAVLVHLIHVIAEGWTDA